MVPGADGAGGGPDEQAEGGGQGGAGERGGQGGGARARRDYGVAPRVRGDARGQLVPGAGEHGGGEAQDEPPPPRGGRRAPFLACQLRPRPGVSAARGEVLSDAQDRGPGIRDADLPEERDVPATDGQPGADRQHLQQHARHAPRCRAPAAAGEDGGYRQVPAEGAEAPQLEEHGHQRVRREHDDQGQGGQLDPADHQGERQGDPDRAQVFHRAAHDGPQPDQDVQHRPGARNAQEVDRDTLRRHPEGRRADPPAPRELEQRAQGEARQRDVAQVRRLRQPHRRRRAVRGDASDVPLLPQPGR
mmetsp:Transcript_20373/g.49287  ORF Transcript_20373/g.49287 Transcript_20373/m.49287 type:complete len:303 (+) Transcript_20373:1806-2714(+)